MMAEKMEISSAPKNTVSLDPHETAMELAADVFAGKKTMFEVRAFLLSIKNPSERLKIQYEFRQLLWTKLGLHQGIDKWGDYTKSLKTLQSRFTTE
jgi:hypothetical protein